MFYDAHEELYKRCIEGKTDGPYSTILALVQSVFCNLGSATELNAEFHFQFDHPGSQNPKKDLDQY